MPKTSVTEGLRNPPETRYEMRMLTTTADAHPTLSANDVGGGFEKVACALMLVPRQRREKVPRNSQKHSCTRGEEKRRDADLEAMRGEALDTNEITLKRSRDKVQKVDRIQSHAFLK
jgi:hypothetical protein